MDLKILSALRDELNKSVDGPTKANYHRFFKETVKFYGVKSGLVDQLGKRYFEKINNLNKKEIFELCEELFKSDYCEEASIAADWTYRLHKQYSSDDLIIFEDWIEKYINNWAKCDTFCNHTMGAFIEKYPEYIEKLKQWTQSKNRWVKRASAVSLIIPAKKGKFLPDIFEIANKLLLDPDDLVQKGYGWMLKSASQSHQKEVFDYVMKNKKIMPRTALRYAIEKMPPDLKKLAMVKK